ncbi:MAG TPA: hypothetical protein VLK82_13530 [Candidatus Tectomicrobia bacterium]|nr:hypothetical protein [Candidatus Tectomicrobia bacterium]
MALMHQLLSVAQLNELNEKELDLLWQAIQNEIITSDEIQTALKRKAAEVYYQMRPGSTPTGPTGAEEARRRPRRRK